MVIIQTKPIANACRGVHRTSANNYNQNVGADSISAPMNYIFDCMNKNKYFFIPWYRNLRVITFHM